MKHDLQGTSVALLISPRGTEDPEFVQPRDVLNYNGATVDVISTETGSADTVTGDLDPKGTHDIDHAVGSVDAANYDALVIPGGTVGADTLRSNEKIVSFVRAFHEQGKTIAAICHAPWVLIEAGVVADRRMTSYPSLRTDLENAGATWVDEECVVDQGLITSRTPDDLDVFCGRIVSELAGS